MPKRKNKTVKHSRSAEKIKRRRLIIYSESSDSENSNNEAPKEVTEVPPLVEEVPPSVEEVPPESFTLAPEEPSLELTLGTDAAEPELCSEILLALGAKTSEVPEYGDKIHQNLADLWLPLLRKGLPKEEKEKVLKEYLVPRNCPLLIAPKLNPEISAAITEASRLRDKKMAYAQQQLGAGISAINRAMDVLLSKDLDKLKIIKILSDSCRILNDLHHRNTQTRIKLLTPSLDKSFLQILDGSCRDETLFGSKLSEKIKTSKTIEKQGLQIKKPTTSTAIAPSASRAPQNRGNWGAPPRYPPNKNNQFQRGGGRKPINLPTTSRKPLFATPAPAKQPAKPQSRAQTQQ